MPLLIVVGVISGAYTATESAAAASAYALIVCIFIFKSIKVQNLGKILFNSAKNKFYYVSAFGNKQLVQLCSCD